MSEQQYGALADRIARQNGIPTDLFRRLVTAESSWNPSAGSSAGARGLAQLMPGTARGLGVKNILDPAQNLGGGARYLRQQYDRFGRWDLALAAYNAGPGAVQQHGGVPPYRETQAYVPRVLGGMDPTARAAAAGGDEPDAAPAAGPSLAAALSGGGSGGMDRMSLLAAVRSMRSGDPGARVGALQQIMGARQAAQQAQSFAQSLAAGQSGGGSHAGHDHGPGGEEQWEPTSGGGDGGYGWAQELADRFGLRLSSTYRSPADNARVGGSSTSAHLTRGGAADFAGSAENMRRLAEWASGQGRYGEVFYDPLGRYWDNGRVNQGGIGGHSDHVHITFGGRR